MSRYLIILSLIISLLIGVSSCSPPLKGYSPSSESFVIFRPVFNEDFEKAFYKSIIKFNKKQLTGIVLIKKIPVVNSYRTVFMSETGLKYFDFEFFPTDSVEIYYVMDALDRKSLVKIVIADLLLLFRSQVDQGYVKMFQSEKEDGWILHFKQNGKYYYKYESQAITPKEVERRACLSPKTNIEIKSYQDNIPTSIFFTHGFLGYTMKLELLNQ